MSAFGNSQALGLWEIPVEEVVNQKNLLWGYVDAIIKSDFCSVSADEIRDICYAICEVDDLEGTNIQSLGVNTFYYSNEAYLDSLSDTEILSLSDLEAQQVGYSELPKLQLARVIVDVLTLALQNDNILGDCWYCCESTEVVSKAMFGTSHKVLECPTNLVSDNAELGLVLIRLREIRDIFRGEVLTQSDFEKDVFELFDKLVRCEQLLFDFTSEDKRSIILNKLNFTQIDLQNALFRYMPKMEIPEVILDILGKDARNFVSKYSVCKVDITDSTLIQKKISDYVAFCHIGFLQVLEELLERGYRQHGGAVSASVVLMSRNGDFPYRYKMDRKAQVDYPQADISSAVRSLVSKLFVESESSTGLDDFIETILYVYSNILCKNKPSVDEIKEMCR